MGDPQPLGFDPMRVVATAPAMRTTLDDGTILVGPLPEQLPEEMRRTLADGRSSYDFMSAFGALWGSASMLYSQMQPLKDTADRLPQIVAHSDSVHSELQQGLDAIRTAVSAVQVAAQSLTTSLGPIAQTSSQAYAAAAVANSKVSALEGRVFALEAREVALWRASGNLPTLALNATTTVLCPWSVSPTALPGVKQCVVIQVAGSSAQVTPTAVSASGVTVSVAASFA